MDCHHLDAALHGLFTSHVDQAHGNGKLVHGMQDRVEVPAYIRSIRM